MGVKRAGGVCVLVSGGLDSTVLLSRALKHYRRVTPVYVRAGMRWEKAELDALKKILKACRSARLAPLQILDAPAKAAYGRHWSLGGGKVPGWRSGRRAVYLPGRNLSLIVPAAVYAAGHGMRRIEIGVLKRNSFRDGTPQFMRRLEKVLGEALETHIEIRAPFARRTKEALIADARPPRLLELSLSCLSPLRGGEAFVPCGACNKCAERSRAFRALKQLHE